MSDERDQSERRYIAALIALDAAAEPSRDLNEAAAAATADVARLTRLWSNGTVDGASIGFVRRIALEFQRLLPWNRRKLLGATIAAINRQTDATRALIDANQHFRSHVVWYAQTVAGFAGSTRRNDPTAQDVEKLMKAFEALQSHWLMHVESLGTREARYDARMAALNAAYHDVNESLALAQQQIQALVRSAGATARSASPVASGAADAPATSAGSEDTAYVGFEDRFRGSRDDIRTRLMPYVELLAGSGPVLEVGCGRGELLELLRDRGVAVHGIDANPAMVDECRSRGVPAEHADALAHLTRQPDASLGGIVAIQVVEHLEPRYLAGCLEAAYRSLKTGGTLLLETINPACWAAFFDSYIRDLTHQQPLHPDTLKYLVQAAGFTRIDVRYLSPVEDQHRLQQVRVDSETDPAYASQSVKDLVEAVNTNAGTLNRQLFSYRDYAIVATK